MATFPAMAHEKNPMAQIIFPWPKKNGKKVAMAQINSLRHKIHRLSRKEKKKDIKLTLVISKLKGPSETLRDIRTSTYQICRMEENTNRTTNIHK